MLLGLDLQQQSDSAEITLKIRIKILCIYKRWLSCLRSNYRLRAKAVSAQTPDPWTRLLLSGCAPQTGLPSRAPRTTSYPAPSRIHRGPSPLFLKTFKKILIVRSFQVPLIREGILICFCSGGCTSTERRAEFWETSGEDLDGSQARGSVWRCLRGRVLAQWAARGRQTPQRLQAWV